MFDLDRIVPPSQAAFSRRFSRQLLDDLMHRGDPEADEATAALHEDEYDPDGTQLARLRTMAEAGEARAEAFFARSATDPPWLDRRLIEHGQRLALAFPHHYGMSLMHSLFSGAIFARATLVTNSTGRLGSNPGRRIQETGAFVAAILAPGGLEPGALGFETAVRVRLLHGSIRQWIQRSPGFSELYVGEPIDQTMLAMTLSLFDYLNLRSLSRLGLPLSEEDVVGHHHLWRYVGYLLGMDERLLTETVEEERELWSALVAHQAFPELFGAPYLDLVVETVGGLMGAGMLHRNFIRNVFLHLSGGEWFGTEEGWLPDPALVALRLSSFGLGTARQLVPFLSTALEAYGSYQLDSARKLAHSHGFDVKIENEDTEMRAANVRALADGVRARFTS